MVSSQDRAIRTWLTRFIAEHGCAPAIDEVARVFACAADDIGASYRRLHDAHGLVLHPVSTELWAVHPFALWPASCWVATARQRWWANCIWCALGVAAMVREDARIAVRLGGEAPEVEITVTGGAVAPRDLLVHLTVPVARFWDNVIFTCGTILPFRSAADVDDWCARHRFARGAVVALPVLHELAREWYGDWLTEWRRKTADEARAVFTRLGLTGKFWDPDAAWR